jgi:preprotein translocase subunit SecA
MDEARTPMIISGAAPKNEINAPSVELKSSVSNLVELQQKVCSRLASEAKIMMENSGGEHHRDAHKKP